MKKNSLKKEIIDIALIAEGTYPFVSGGVSTWIHEIIKSFPEYKFAIIFLGGKPRSDYNTHYEIPENVVYFQFINLFEKLKISKPRTKKFHDTGYKNVIKLHEWFLHPSSENFKEIENCLRFFEPNENKVTAEDFSYSHKSWEHICESYTNFCTDPSFIDYFWTVHNIHSPIWKLREFVTTIPKAKVFHTISTGYAGFLGSLLKIHFKRPLILSEHGIYTKERRIELFKANWIQDNRNIFIRDNSLAGYYKQLWERFFESLARICYKTADPIISLFTEATHIQILEGADAKKTLVIPNGVNIDEFKPLREERHENKQPIICLLGRVTPIKDIMNFIHSIKTVKKYVSEIEAWIAGSEEEDPAYAEECKMLVKKLKLSNHIKFLGKKKVKDIFPKIKLLVLSSVSEGQPMSILEGFASGIPVVATDVGSCHELIFGAPSDDEDQKIGAGGNIVNLADPIALGNAIAELLTDNEKWKNAQQAAIKRVETFYDKKRMITSYRKIYEKGIASWRE